MNTLDYFVNKYNLDLKQKSPISIPIYRDEMARCLCDLNFKIGAEVGTWQGQHARILLENNPGLKLYCIDPWEYYHEFKDYHSYDYAPAFEETKIVTKGYNVEIIKKYSLDAVKDFKDESLDFVYIDANHMFRHVIDDLDSWKHKVKKGGIIFGHDYHRSRKRWRTNQVYYAIGAYLYANRVDPWFALGRVGVNIEDGNGVRAWMFIR